MLKNVKLNYVKTLFVFIVVVVFCLGLGLGLKNKQRSMSLPILPGVNAQDNPNNNNGQYYYYQKPSKNVLETSITIQNKITENLIKTKFDLNLNKNLLTGLLLNNSYISNLKIFSQQLIVTNNQEYNVSDKFNNVNFNVSESNLNFRIQNNTKINNTPNNQNNCFYLFNDAYDKNLSLYHGKYNVEKDVIVNKLISKHYISYDYRLSFETLIAGSKVDDNDYGTKKQVNKNAKYSTVIIYMKDNSFRLFAQKDNLASENTKKNSFLSLPLTSENNKIVSLFRSWGVIKDPDNANNYVYTNVANNNKEKIFANINLYNKNVSEAMKTPNEDDKYIKDIITNKNDFIKNADYQFLNLNNLSNLNDSNSIGNLKQFTSMKVNLGSNNDSNYTYFKDSSFSYYFVFTLTNNDNIKQIMYGYAQNILLFNANNKTLTFG